MRRLMVLSVFGLAAVFAPMTASASSPQAIPAPAYPGPTLPGVTVPASVVPGGLFTMTGEDFEPNCPFQVILNTDPSVVLGSDTINPSGGFTLLLTAPSGAIFSEYGGVVPVQIITTSPCNPEVANANLLAVLPPTL